VGHTLDAVEAVCALVRSTDPEECPAVLRWLPESIAADVLPAGPAADAVIVLAAAGGPATVCPEVGEGNQHLAAIRDKVRAYNAALDARTRPARPRRYQRLLGYGPPEDALMQAAAVLL
jgi:hypothetical protein